MKHLGLMLFAIASLISASGQVKEDRLTWTDSTRDVYINGEIDRTAQVLVCESGGRTALISAKLEQAVILQGPENTVSTLPKSAFIFARDRATATTDSNPPVHIVSKCSFVDGPTHGFDVGGKSILIDLHKSPSGELPEQELWEVVPVWRHLTEAYEADPAAVASLKNCDAEMKITVALGTWCPDSKRNVPRLLKALREAGNGRLQVKLIAVANKFQGLVDTIRQYRIVHVPTVVVERDGREIGRIVENPAGKTMEGDLAAILARASEARDKAR